MKGLIAPQTPKLVAALLASHGAQLHRFLLARVANAADVPDVAQEVYLRMLRIPNAESIRSPEAYLFTVARHVVQQHSLKLSATPRSRELTQMLASTITPVAADPALEIDAQQCLEELQRALDDLGPKPRAVFLLHRREGLALEDIGARLGISLPMVKKYLMKSLVHLRQRLQQEEE